MVCKRLAVDVGNSSIKVACFGTPEATALPRPTHVIRVAPDELTSLHEQLDSSTHEWIVGSVQKQFLGTLTSWLAADRPDDSLRLVSYEDFAIQLDVLVPGAVGIDRVAAAVAANQLRTPAQTAVIVDVGTTMTIDVVSRTGVFLGGIISPGYQMRLDAMHAGTDGLPPFQADNRVPELVGRDTEAAMRSGAYWSMISQVEGILGRIRADHGSNVLTLLTGGSAVPLLSSLQVDVQHEPHLVLSGLALAQP